MPYRMYINGQYIGTIRNGKSLDANVPKAGVYYIEDDILSSRNAVIYDNGLSEYSVVIKRAGGWRTESYNEFYMEKGNVLEQLPSFHWEKLFELQQSMSQSERLLALSVEFWMSAMDDLQEILASEHLFEIIAALQTIGVFRWTIIRSSRCSRKSRTQTGHFGKIRAQKRSFVEQSRIF